MPFRCQEPLEPAELSVTRKPPADLQEAEAARPQRLTRYMMLLFLLRSFFQDGLKTADKLKQYIEKLAADLYNVNIHFCTYFVCLNFIFLLFNQNTFRFLWFFGNFSRLWRVLEPQMYI